MSRGEGRLPVRISMEDPEPMYRQIEGQLRKLILGGHLPPGTRLPPVRALAQDLSCSVITTRRAYQDLEAEGLVRTRQGLGTVVAEIGEEERARHRRSAVLAAFREAVENGLRAGCSPGELYEIFEQAVRQQTKRRDEDEAV